MSYLVNVYIWKLPVVQMRTTSWTCALNEKQHIVITYNVIPELSKKMKETS